MEKHIQTPEEQRNEITDILTHIKDKINPRYEKRMDELEDMYKKSNNKYYRLMSKFVERVSDTIEAIEYGYWYIEESKSPANFNFDCIYMSECDINMNSYHAQKAFNELMVALKDTDKLDENFNPYIFKKYMYSRYWIRIFYRMIHGIYYSDLSEKTMPDAIGLLNQLNIYLDDSSKDIWKSHESSMVQLFNTMIKAYNSCFNNLKLIEML